MVQQTIDSKISNHGQDRTENNSASGEQQLPVAVKKTVLRDLQNENRVTVPNSVGKSPFPKDKDAAKISGAKRLSSECPVSPSCNHSPSSNAVNGHLVYVRRKFEGEIGKNSNSDATNGHLEETTLNRPLVKEPKVSSLQVLPPLTSNLMSSFAKPSVPHSFGKSTARLLPESNHQSFSSELNGIKNLHWEDRYHLLQILLKKLGESGQEDYIQLLRSLSSVDLSRHAVELEKRSIQLSLEEAKELQRVAALNVLGKSMKNVKSPSGHQDP